MAFLGRFFTLSRQDEEARKLKTPLLSSPHRRVRLLVLSTAVLTVALVSTIGAHAQIITIPTSPTTTSSTTTTTAPPPTTPPPPAPPPNDPGSPPPPPSDGGPSTPPSDPGAPPPTDPTAPPGEGEQEHDDAAPVAVPTQYQALMNSVKRTPASNSRKLLDALAPLQDLGVSEEDAIRDGFGRFPVGGAANYVHDWWYPRGGPPFHLHQGTDIFADAGTPVRSPADGILEMTNGGLGGISSYVREPNGTYYYLTHLSGYPPGLVTGQQVKVGDIVGYVGSTGNAAGGAPHVHFEIHMAPANNQFLMPPPGAPIKTTIRDKRGRRVTVTKPAPAPKPVIVGNIADPVLYGRGTLPAMDPKPFLDMWLNDAMANVPNLIAKAQSGRPRAVVATGLLRRFTDGGAFAAPAGPPRSQLLWASSANPSGGPLQLAEKEAVAAASEVDWAALARRELERIEAEKQSRAWARAMLLPTTPLALRKFL